MGAFGFEKAFWGPLVLAGIQREPSLRQNCWTTSFASSWQQGARLSAGPIGISYSGADLWGSLFFAFIVQVDSL